MINWHAVSTVTCVYTINTYGQRTPAQTEVDMSQANVPVNADFMAMIGVSITSDTTATAGQSAVRTIVFDVAAGKFQTSFPVDQLSPFYGLMTGPIEAYTNQKVVESLPVGA